MLAAKKPPKCARTHTDAHLWDLPLMKNPVRDAPAMRSNLWVAQSFGPQDSGHLKSFEISEIPWIGSTLVELSACLNFGCLIELHATLRHPSILQHCFHTAEVYVTTTSFRLFYVLIHLAGCVVMRVSLWPFGQQIFIILNCTALQVV